MFRRAPVIILLIGLCWSNWATAEVSVNYCAKEGTRVLLLIDATTAYDKTDKTQIVEAVNEVHRILKGGDRLIVRTITDSYAHSDGYLIAVSHTAKRALRSEGIINAMMESLGAIRTPAGTSWCDP